MQLVKKDKTVFTKEALRKAFPERKYTITDELVDFINQANHDPDFSGDEFFDTMVSYQDVMLKAGGSIRNYINAIKFCAHLDATNGNVTEAYKRARSEDKFVKERKDAPVGSPDYNALSGAASRYRKSPMVVQLLTQSAMPMYLMFQTETYNAVKVLVDEMNNAQYSKDRISAAKAVLENVKAPENVKVELDIGIKENNAVEQLNDQLAQLASRQVTHLESGTASLEDFGAMKVQDSDILEGEIE